MGQSLSRLQYINGKPHDCINNGKHYIFGDDAGSPDFIQGETEQPLHGLNQSQVLLFFAAEVKERAKGAGIVMTALLKGEIREKLGEKLGN